LVDAAVAGGLQASIVRIAGVYGPGDTHFAARLLDYAASGRISIVGRGDQPSKIIYIDDAVAALMAVLTRSGVPGGRYLLNDPAIPNVEEMVRLAMEALDLKVKIRHVPEELALAAAFAEETRARVTGSPPLLTSYEVKAMGRRCFFSADKARRELGWTSSVGYEQGVKQTIAWLRQQEESMTGAGQPAT
jgi:sterol-4alpha-carboxylate 3-dehydrogenase (decarboxylating)